MTYKNILDQIKPVESGNFLLQYKINGSQYVIFSPVNNKISCIELNTFRELTPFQLAIHLNNSEIIDTEDEFKFDFNCSKENLIKYLFDIELSFNKLELCHVANKTHGYLMYDIILNDKVRNFFRYNEETNEYHLLFDNKICYNIYNINDESSNDIHICWNPVIFSILKSDKTILEKKSSIYLLASSDNVLCYHIFKIIKDKKTPINIHIDNNAYECLQLISSYTKYTNNAKSYDIVKDENNINILTHGWLPNTEINLLSSATKDCTDSLNKLYNTEEKYNPYKINRIGNCSFISCPNNNSILSSLIKQVEKYYSFSEFNFIYN